MNESKAKGGLARAKALTPEQRSQIAGKAAAGRWGHKATHRGNFEKEFGIDVECYVLDDPQKTAVISQRGMAEALGLGQSTGARLPRFVKGEKVAPYVGAELRDKLENPLKFQWSEPVSKLPPTTTYGYDVTILIDLCKAIIQADAEGKMMERQKHIVRQAQTIVSASAKVGIRDLVYSIAGYNATREETIAAFKMYVVEEAREYEKEFPPQLYNEWYRIYELPKPERNRPFKFKHLTLNQVYRPLARSNGKILNLARSKRDEVEKPHKKLHQFLSEVGVKALRTHLGQLLGIAQISKDKAEYERHVEKVFGQQTNLTLPMEEP